MTEQSLPCPHCDHEITFERLPPGTCPHCARTLIVGDAYGVEAMVGRGGMGIVYRGRRIGDGQTVAIKALLLDDDARGWKNAELFERSARVVRGLDHPGVPKTHDFIQDREHGRLYLIREMFDGGTLEERILRDHRRLDRARFRSLLEQSLELLHYLHTLIPPVLHRDIKPANIMFRTYDDWSPVLVDFDTVADVHRGSDLTVVGTPGYSAPEQFIGDASPRSDLYSLGVTMLFVATHLDPSAMPRRDGRFDLQDHLGGIDAASKRVLLKLVEPDRQDRFESARDALRALRVDGADVHPWSPEPVASREASAASHQNLPVHTSSDSVDLPTRIRRDGILAQIPSKSARLWVRVIIAFMFLSSMPLLIIAFVGYKVWRDGAKKE